MHKNEIDALTTRHTAAMTEMAQSDLQQTAQKVKEGVIEAGGVVFGFYTAAPCDAFPCGSEPLKYILPHGDRDLI